MPVLVWDINAEWGQSAPDEVRFVQQAESLKRSTIVWEEATTFLEHHGSRITRKVRGMISRRRHNENTHFLLFTSLGAVPKMILHNVDRVILFKTNDLPEDVHAKFKGWRPIIDAYERQRAEPSNYIPIDVHIFGA
jgi:hypothetical protein